jgi:PAS domain S-box-containing protein
MSDSGNYNIRDLLQEILSLNSKIAELENDFQVLKNDHAKEIHRILKGGKDNIQVTSTSEQVWHSVFQAIGQPTFILDKDHRIKAANNAVLKACNKTEDEITGMYCYHLFHGNSIKKPPLNCPCDKMLKSGDFYTGEMEVEALNGTYLVCCTPVYDDKGNIESIIHVATDITSRKIEQEALLNSETRVMALLNAIPDIMFRFNSNGVVLDYKAEVTDLFTSPDEIIGRNLKDLMPPYFISLIDEQTRLTLKNNKMQTFEYQLNIPNVGLRNYEARMVTSGKDEVIAIVRDNTEEKHNSQALLISETNMMIAQKIAKLGSWELDLKTNTGVWSAEMYNLLGLDYSEGVPFLDKFFDRIHPDDRQNIMDFHNQVLKTGIGGSVESRSNPEFLSNKIFISNIEPVFNDKHEIIKAIGTLQDITEQRQTQDKIRKLNRIYSLHSEINKIIVRVLEPKELFESICKIAVEKGNFRMAWIGLSENKILDHTIAASAGYTGDFLELIRSLLINTEIDNGPKAYLSKGKYYVSNNLAKDITIKPIRELALKYGYKSLASFPLIPFGNIFGTLNLYSDEVDFFDEVEIELLNELAIDVSFAIEVFQRETERKKTEDALTLQHHLFRFLIDSLPDHIYFKDLESRFISVNKAQANVFDLTDPLLANGKTDFDFFTNEHARKAFEDEQNILHTGNPIINKEEKETWPDGSETWVSTTKLPLYDPEAKLMGTFGLSRDITGRKHILEELKQAKEKAEESDRLKTAFLANMSHEIRTPMNGILGFADLLKNPNLTGDQQQKYITVIEQSGRRMLNIINDIVSISKIEAGQMEIHLSETHINQLMDHLSTFFGPETIQKSLQLSFRNGLSNERCRIKTDKNKLAQIFTNLIKNALKFTDNGGIEFGYSLDNKLLTFFVKDTGIGINPEMKDIIFERFRQGNESYAREYEGAGLGLAISKAYVEMLGGTIWLESEPGKGTCFYFTLPYDEFQGKSVTDNETSSLNTQKKMTILVVDDDEISILYLQEILNLKNLKLITTSNGKEALETLRSNPDVDLVFMDIKMPVMDGLEATRQIKLIRPDIPVIAITAYALNRDEQRAKAAGCDDYISKPIDKNKLFKWIDTTRKTS